MIVSSFPPATLVPPRPAVAPPAAPASHATLDAFVPSPSSLAAAAAAPASARASSLGGYAANVGLSLAGGVAGGVALGAGIGLLVNPSAVGSFASLGMLGGSTLGTLGGSISSCLKGHETGKPFQPGNALGAGAASGAVGMLGAFVVVLIALGNMT